MAEFIGTPGIFPQKVYSLYVHWITRKNKISHMSCLMRRLLPPHMSQALSRLHQLEILDCTLVVEFAKGQDPVTVLKDPPVSDR